MENNDNSLAETAIESIEALMGKHPGYRRAHAKGSYYEAIFTPNGQAAAYTTAAHLQQKAVKAVVRFSDSSPNPKMIDGLSPVKGMSVEFHLPAGEVTYLVGVTVPVFLTKTPEAFVEMLRLAAEKPGPRDLVKMLIKYPESKAAFRIIKNTKPFLSYSTSCYYPIHAFYFVNKEGKRQAVKYKWVPDETFSLEAKKEAAIHTMDYLEKELDEQLPVGFTLYVTLGEEGDPVDDSTASWPEERTTFAAGHLKIRQKIQQPNDQVIFDPTIVPRGIECSADPVLHARPNIYAASFKRRKMGL
ncbi:catalase family peroxidase [Domibacillus indicus]|uniref:catalase family peroxidase n=1 Tax=Domibacillus indicus TaxID=1437523 RepID=UPI0006181BF8|nr:catalase family peroxidase [Domibacillus indicus]